METIESKQFPTPVAWADLVEGETYYGSIDEATGVSCDVFEFALHGHKFCLVCDGCFPWNEDEMRKDPEGRPMIYASASDAVAAMKAALDQWLEGVGK